MQLFSGIVSAKGDSVAVCSSGISLDDGDM